MDFTFEVFTGIILDMAMLALVFNLVRKREHGSTAERFTAICMGLGFMIWCISKAISGNYGIFAIAALGFMLSYTAFVFTFSRE